MKKLKASATIEASYIVPLILVIVASVIYLTFYMHDKNIIIGAAYETAVAGGAKMRWEEENIEQDLQKFYQGRIEGKLIFFRRTSVEVKCSEEEIIVTAAASKRKFHVNIIQKYRYTKPEESLRKIRRIYGNAI